jgi:hypothetical protein
MSYDILYGSNHQICNKAISDSTLSKHMRDKELAGVPHGFRTSLKTWMSKTQQVSREVSEMVISHQTGSRIERAYNRTDYFEQRRPYMESWADFLDQGYKNVCS